MMSRDLKDKTVVVTGGAEGLGFEIANHYLAKQAKLVIILDINDRKGVDAVNILKSKYGLNKAEFIRCDVTTDLNDIFAKIITSHKTVDVLVNNAGVIREDSVKVSVDINVIALMEWTYKFWDYMRTDKGGKGGTIINISSIFGFRIISTTPIYQATKFAVYGFTKSLGAKYNYDRSGVRVVALCPGITRTSIVQGAKPRDQETFDDMLAEAKDYERQEAEDVGRGAVEVFESADSGSAWLIEGGKPALELI